MSFSLAACYKHSLYIKSEAVVGHVLLSWAGILGEPTCRMAPSPRCWHQRVALAAGMNHTAFVTSRWHPPGTLGQHFGNWAMHAAVPRWTALPVMAGWWPWPLGKFKYRDLTSDGMFGGLGEKPCELGSSSRLSATSTPCSWPAKRSPLRRAIP